MKPSTESKAAYHHGNLREALLAAALSLLEQDGPSALTVRGLAATAGVSRAAPAHHFSSKADLLRAAAAEILRRLGRAMREAAHDAPPGWPGRLPALGDAYIRFGVAHPAWFRFAFSFEQSPDEGDELHAAQEEGYGVLYEEALALAQGDVDVAEHICAHAWSVVHGATTLWLGGLAQPTVGKNRALSIDGFIRRVLNPPNSDAALLT